MNLLKKYILLFSLLVIQVGFEYIHACGGGDYEGPDLSVLFAPEVSGDRDLTPFFYEPSSTYYFSDEASFNTQYPSDYELNLTSWRQYIGKKTEDFQISNLIYETSISDIKHLRELIYSEKQNTVYGFYKSRLVVDENGEKITLFDTLPVPIAEIIKVKGKSVAIAILDYLTIAKKCEVFAPKPLDYWYEEYDLQEETQQSDAYPLIQSMASAINKTNDKWLKDRYVFQLIRLCSYIKEPMLGIAYSDSFPLTLKSSDTYTYYRTMGYIASCHYKTQDYATANYLYSILFANYQSSRIAAHWSFRPQNDSDWVNCIAKAKTPAELENIWVLHGLTADNGLTAMQAIYAINPKSDKLAMLLSREINKTESNTQEPLLRKYLSRYFDSWESKSLLSDTALLTFIEKVANARNTINHNLWYLGAGYLQMLNANTIKAKHYFNKINKPDTLIAPQLRLFQILIRIAESTIDEKFEEDIVHDLIWLSNTDKYSYLRKTAAFENARRALAFRYYMYLYSTDTENPDTVLRYESLIYMLNNEAPATYTNLVSLLNFIETAPKTRFNQFVINHFQYTIDQIRYDLGVMALYDYDFDAAIDWFNSTKIKTYETYGDPFFIRNIDCHDCDHADPFATTYTQLSFAVRMRYLTILAEDTTNKERATTALFLLGNGYYNMTYYGNGRILSGRYLYVDYSYYNHHYMYSKRGARMYESNYFNCHKAKACYLAAAELSIDKEFKAKCLFMAAKCALNNQYEGEAENEKNEFYCILRNDFIHTQYLKELLKECSYLQDFECDKE
jgi:hypothetical protein